LAAVRSEPDDYALMEAIASRRDSAALRALYDRHSGLVFTLCTRVLRDRGDAEDVLIDVFFELWDKADRYDAARGSPVSYLVQLARSRAIDRLRSGRSDKAGPRATASTPDAIDGSASALRPAAANPLNDVATSEQRELVIRAIAQLEPVQRQAIECAYYDGLSHSEIAEKLDKPLGTVKTWIRQGLIRLRDALRSDSGEDEQRPRAGSSAIANTVDERSGPR